MYILDGSIFAVLFETTSHCFGWLSLLVWLLWKWIPWWTPFFDNNFLATDANLIFLSKMDKDYKSVIDNIFFQFLCDFKNRCHRMEYSTLYQLLIFTFYLFGPKQGVALWQL